VAVASVAALVTFVPAHATPRGAECQLSGSATISPGLTQTARTQQVTLSNVKLTGCHAGNVGSPGVPTKTSGAVSVSPNPITSKASCLSGNLALTATILWSTGTSTTAAVTTHGVLANQLINGTVTSSTDPNIQAGDLLAGDAAFKPTTTTQNCVTVPVTKVTFSGAIGLGSPN
jgi:hypothetical protein